MKLVISGILLNPATKTASTTWLEFILPDYMKLDVCPLAHISARQFQDTVKIGEDEVEDHV